MKIIITLEELNQFIELATLSKPIGFSNIIKQLLITTKQIKPQSYPVSKISKEVLIPYEAIAKAYIDNQDLTKLVLSKINNKTITSPPQLTTEGLLLVTNNN